MAEINVKPVKPWHIRARKPYVAPSKICHPLPESDRARDMPWPGFQHRYHGILNAAQRNSGIQPEYFHDQFINGLMQLSADPYRVMHEGISQPHITLFQQYGALCELAPPFHPSAQEAAKAIIRENMNDRGAIEFLINGQNLRAFMYTLNHLLSEAHRKHEAEIRQANKEKRFTSNINFLDLQMQVTFEKQKVAAVEIDAARIRAEEERAAGKRKAIELIAGYGYAIELAGIAVNMRNEKTVVRLLEDKKNREIAAAFFKAFPAESLNALVETAVDLAVRKDNGPLIAQAVLAAAEVLRSDPGMIAGLIADLENTFRNENKYTVPAEPRARIAVLQNILVNTPEAVPLLIKEHDRNHSRVKAAFSRSLGVFGLRSKDVSTRLLYPLIMEAVAGREGQDSLLSYVHERAISPDAPESAMEQARIFRVARGRLGKELALCAARNALKSDVRSIPVFAGKSAPEEIRESIIALANTKEFRRKPETLTPREAYALLFMASKIQHFMDLMRTESEAKTNEVATMLALDNLDQLDGKYEVSGVRVPDFDYLARYRDGIYNGQTVFKKADQQIEFLVARAANGNLISAGRVIEILKGRGQPFWNAMPSPINEHNLKGNGRENKLPEIEHFARYACCFLAADRPEYKNGFSRDLQAALASDPGEKQFFLSLKAMLAVVAPERGYLLNNFIKELVINGYAELAVEVRIFNLLFNTRELNRHSSQRGIARAILDTIIEHGKAWEYVMEMVQTNQAIGAEALLSVLIHSVFEGEQAPIDLARIRGKARAFLESSYIFN